MIVAFFNQSKSEKIAKEKRKRERLEDLYCTLIKIENSYHEMQSQVIRKVHYNKSLNNEFLSTISEDNLPLIGKVAMLIKLYFPELREVYSKFELAKNTFGKEYAELIFKDYKSEPLKKKQEVCAKFAVLQLDVLGKIRDIQKMICNLIED